MAYIYSITNKINNKKYIGKTCRSVEYRWKEHIRTARKNDEQHRTLYKAINKYGVENFIVETIEECASSLVNEREQYWIKHYNTLHNGYNETLGGDGSFLYDISKEELLECIQQRMTQKDIAHFYGCDEKVIKRFFDDYGIRNKELQQQKQRKEVCTIYNNQQLSFPSQSSAARWLISQGITTATVDSISANIGRCCKGTRTECCGLYWYYK